MTFPNLFSVPLNKLTISLIFFVLCFAIYHDTFNHAFIHYDDLTYIEAIKENDSGLWSLINWALTDTVNVNWHPLTLLSLITDYKLYGMNAGGYHATSLAIHLANTFLVLLIFKILTKKLLHAFLVALIFLVHPLNVETVSWVAERKGVLGALFTLASIYFYLQFRITTRRLFYGISLLSFLAALLSKAAFVTLPILLIIIDLYLALINKHKLNKRILQNTIVAQLPFFLLALFIGIISIYVHSTSGALISDNLYPLETRLAKTIAFYPTYIFQLLFPIGLHLSYPYRAPTALELWIGILFFTTLSTLAIKFRNSMPAIFLGWFWYVVLLFPVSGIIQSGSHLHADRYAYLPIIGIVFLIISIAAQFLSRFEIRQRLYMVIISLLILILATISWNQHRTWKNTFSVFYNTYSHDPQNVFANTYLTGLYLQAGNIQEGMRFYSRGRQADPYFLYLYESAYEALLSQQKSDIALSVLNDALKAVSELNVSGGAKYNSYRDMYLLKIATIYINQGQYQNAAESLQHSIKINPNNIDFKFLYGYANYMQHNYQLAEEHLQQIVTSHPEHYEAVLLLIKVYRDSNKHDKAMLYISNALNKFPEHEDQLQQLAATIQFD